jgi:hypothetical protein
MWRTGQTGLLLVLCVFGARSALASAEYSTLYVVRRGWHIDVGFDTADLSDPMSAISTGFPGVQHLLFGFGDARYLRSQRHGAGTLLAALWPGDALILTTALVVSPEAAFGAAHVFRLRVTAAQSEAAQRFIWTSLALDQAAVILGGRTGVPGPYEGSTYFRAMKRYSAVHTCNTWAAEVLRAAALPVTARGVIFAGELWTQVTRLPETAH